MNRYIYTFENRCIQEEKLSLDDGTMKIFLNTKGTVDDVPRPLRLFLDYINNGEVTDDFTKQIDDAVVEIRSNKRWRKRIMTLEEYAKEQAELKKDEWLEEGRQQGLEQGQVVATDRINMLNSKLIEEGRLDDLKASTVDKDLQKQLLEEFGLI